VGSPDSPKDEDDHDRAQGGLDHPGLGVFSHEIQHTALTPFLKNINDFRRSGGK
jgi:hypothetical protein